MNKITEQFLAKTLEYLNSTEAFLQKNVPAYIEELLVFSFYEHVLSVVFILSLLVGTAFLTFIAHKKAKSPERSREGKEGYEFLCGAGVFVTGIFFIMFILSSAKNITQAIKIKVAPRVYLVEKLSSQIKGESK
jgi:hypothetical protein